MPTTTAGAPATQPDPSRTAAPATGTTTATTSTNPCLTAAYSCFNQNTKLQQRLQQIQLNKRLLVGHYNSMQQNCRK